jgi:hypothetical protein
MSRPCVLLCKQAFQKGDYAAAALILSKVNAHLSLSLSFNRLLAPHSTLPDHRLFILTAFYSN